MQGVLQRRQAVRQRTLVRLEGGHAGGVHVALEPLPQAVQLPQGLLHEGLIAQTVLQSIIANDNITAELSFSCSRRNTTSSSHPETKKRNE